ncbi:MAG: replication-associated recombination protein A [Deltaproteobacteria bacterium]|nr:replication-associated recombination protein A [Deltaproteobacteria bacterium]
MLFEDINTEKQKTVEKTAASSAPAAERMRPESYEHIRGQDHIWGKDAPLRKLVEADRSYSLIFWGPPGTGKTSLARLIGQHSGRHFCELSAVHAGVKEIREVFVASASSDTRWILFMDEIHRLSKSQQDVLLPALERGLVRFIGATTENPSFEVNHAIASRSLVFRFEKINEDSMLRILKDAIIRMNPSGTQPAVDDEVFRIIAGSAAGDARRALNLLEAALVCCQGSDSIRKEDLRKLETCFPAGYDKNGDQHFDTVSAMIKSVRGSQPDAALYYLARMLDGGESPEFIARRLLIAASEDIGNANPHALSIAMSAFQAVTVLGMPEARIILGQLCTFLASAPKSNRAYRAMDQALDCARKTRHLKIPMQLRNAPTSMMKEFGYGKNYVYAHDHEEEARKMDYLPEELKSVRFYEPRDSGFERQIRSYLDRP